MVVFEISIWINGPQPLSYILYPYPYSIPYHYCSPYLSQSHLLHLAGLVLVLSSIRHATTTTTTTTTSATTRGTDKSGHDLYPAILIWN